MLTIELPYAPSLNNYYRHVGPRTLISRAGRQFRARVKGLLRPIATHPLEGRLAISVEIYPPDRRRRDVDNLQKSIFDSLQHAGLFRDDSQIVWLLTYKAGVVPGGRILIRIGRLDRGLCQALHEAALGGAAWN